MKEISRGAEAVLYLEKHEGEIVLIKERVKKGYRVSELDNGIRKERTAREMKLLLEAKRAGANVPVVMTAKEYRLIMEFLKGERVKELLNSNKRDGEEIAEQIGREAGLLHENGIIHGDLTTSNMIIRDGRIYFIDFGLGMFSQKPEDQGVDLIVFRDALKSTHFSDFEVLWQSFIKGYKQTNKTSKEALKALASIERRGRYVNRE